MLWQEVCADRSLQDLPYKIELNREGMILMSPAKNRHAILQGRLQRLLVRYLKDQGEVIPECAMARAWGCAPDFPDRPEQPPIDDIAPLQDWQV
ncbi:MAG: hypothetical protein WCP34_11035 [Pseudomonadota bacterium]